MHARSRGEVTRDQILDVATRCFAQSGYDAVGVAEICRRAGVSKGAFYYHFESKQAVFLESLSRWLRDFQHALEATAAGARTVPERLLKMSRLMSRVFGAGDSQTPMFLEFWTQASRDPTIRAATTAPYRSFQRFFADLIRQGVAEGTLAPVDPEAAAQTVISLASGMLLQGLLDPQGQDWGQVAEHSMRILLDGLGSQSS
jgi:AcrR family transcriptional regulator